MKSDESAAPATSEPAAEKKPSKKGASAMSGTKAKEVPAAAPAESKGADKAAGSKDPAVGKTSTGEVVYEGSRGGFYYLTKSVNKSYVKDFVGAKIVGKTADGKNIFEGPRGGQFYYNDAGDKVYVKK